KAGSRFSDKIYNSINRLLVKSSCGNIRYLTVAGFVAALVVGTYYSRQLEIGDVSIGKALFYANHPYNVAYDRIIDKGFAGVSQLTIIAEGHKAGVFREVAALNALEKFQRYKERTKSMAGGSASGVDVIRQLYRMFEEGIPKWAVLPSDSHDVGNMFSYFLMSAGAPALERFVDRDLQNATITVF